MYALTSGSSKSHLSNRFCSSCTEERHSYLAALDCNGVKIVLGKSEAKLILTRHPVANFTR